MERRCYHCFLEQYGPPLVLPQDGRVLALTFASTPASPPLPSVSPRVHSKVQHSPSLPLDPPVDP